MRPPCGCDELRMLGRRSHSTESLLGRGTLRGPRPGPRLSSGHPCVPSRTEEARSDGLRRFARAQQCAGAPWARSPQDCAARRICPASVPIDEAPRTTKGPRLLPGPSLRTECAWYYLRIFTTVPAPTVRPPSRIAKRSPSSMAIGWMRLTVISVVSPGMTISVPSGSVMMPVTSVVRK